MHKSAAACDGAFGAGHFDGLHSFPSCIGQYDRRGGSHHLVHKSMLKFLRGSILAVIGALTVSLWGCLPGGASPHLPLGTFGGGGPGFLAVLDVKSNSLTLTIWHQKIVDGPVLENSYSLKNVGADAYKISQQAEDCGGASVVATSGGWITVKYGGLAIKFSPIEKSWVEEGVQQLKHSQQYALHGKSVEQSEYSSIVPRCAK